MKQNIDIEGENGINNGVNNEYDELNELCSKLDYYIEIKE